MSYDPEGAAALLDEAGWLLDDDGYRYKDGIRAELDLLYSTGDSVRQALCADFAGSWRSWASPAPWRGGLGHRL